MTAPASPSPVCAERIGGLHRLEPLARMIFGEGDRPTGWFARKLVRECVRPNLSIVVTRRPDAPADSDAWIGYALMGNPSSCAPWLRTAGVGIVANARGDGYGRALLTALLAQARRTGAAGVRTTASRASAPYYERLGYTRVRDEVSVVAFGTQGNPVSPTSGRPPGATPMHAPLRTWFGPNLERHVHGQWLPEAWEHTPAACRCALRWQTAGGTVDALVSREGLAWVCHQLVSDPGCTTAELACVLEGWRQAHRPETPLVLVGLAPAAALTHILTAHGWAVAQRSVLCEREFDDDASAAAPQR